MLIFQFRALQIAEHNLQIYWSHLRSMSPQHLKRQRKAQHCEYNVFSTKIYLHVLCMFWKETSFKKTSSFFQTFHLFWAFPFSSLFSWTDLLLNDTSQLMRILCNYSTQLFTLHTRFCVWEFQCKLDGFSRGRVLC